MYLYMYTTGTIIIQNYQITITRFKQISFHLIFKVNKENIQ